jgi:hypothetical protein
MLKRLSQRSTLHNVFHIFYVLLFLLAPLVAGREIPEVIRLADDASNDGIVIAVSSKTLAPPLSENPSPSFMSICVQGCAHPSEFQAHVFAVNAKTGQDLLHLIAVRRT